MSLSAMAILTLAFSSSPTQAGVDTVRIRGDLSKSIHTMRGGMGASWDAIEELIPLESDRSHGGSAWLANPPVEDEGAWDQV